MKLKQVTGLGRLVDPHYPTNLAILVVATAVGIISLVVQLVAGNSFGEAVSWSLRAFFLTSLAWAIGRELDPDYEWSAFVGVGLFLISLLFFDIFAASPALLVILVMRIVNRSSGKRATWLDSILITTFAGWLVGSTGHWEYGVVVVAAFLLDAILPAPSRRQLLFASILLLVTLFWLSAIVGSRAIGFPFRWSEWMVAGITAVPFTTLIIPRSNQIRSLGDATQQPLIPQRVQVAQLLAVVAGVLFLWQGADKLLALWSAMLGVSLYRIYMIIRGKI